MGFANFFYRQIKCFEKIFIVFLILQCNNLLLFADINAQDTSNVDEIHPGGITGYDLDGSGVVIGMWDSGPVRVTHKQFDGRVILEDDSGSKIHATKVAGIIAGSGKENPEAEGMAPNSILYCWNITNDLIEIDENAHRLAVSNHSYTSSVSKDPDDAKDNLGILSIANLAQTTEFYTKRIWVFDQIAYDRDHIMVVSAGNDQNSATEYQKIQNIECGYQTVCKLGSAKNIITVGSIKDLLDEPPAPIDRCMTDYSGWGPTIDGRIKPDLVANGDKQITCDCIGDHDYLSFGGTSASAPVVTGSIACLVQLYRSIYHSDPHASLMKAILIHTAVDGGEAIGPDYCFGWGLLDARAAADFIYNQNQGNQWFSNDAFEDSPIVYKGMSEARSPICVTLVWTDPAGNPLDCLSYFDKKLLVNDLDLIITGPDGCHYPWTLDPAHPKLPAKRDEENHIDNIEQVWIESPVSGEYTIQIGGRINQVDSQPFSLCVSGLSLKKKIPQVLVQNPYHFQRIDNSMQIKFFAKSPKGIKRIVHKLDGEKLDNFTIHFIHGSYPASYYDDLMIDTQSIPNGKHIYRLEIEDRDGDVWFRSVYIWVFHADPTRMLTIDGPALQGELTLRQQRIFYTLEIEKSGVYSIETSSMGDPVHYLDTMIYIYDSDFHKIAHAEDDDDGEGLYSKLDFELEANHKYYVYVASNSSMYGYFNLSVKSLPMLPQPSPISTLVKNTTIQQEMDDGDIDSYDFTVEEYGKYSLEIESLWKMKTAIITFPSGYKLEFGLHNEKQPKKINLELEPGEYRVDIFAGKGRGPYTIVFEGINISKPLKIGDEFTFEEIVPNRLNTFWYFINPKKSAIYIVEVEGDPNQSFDIFLCSGSDLSTRLFQSEFTVNPSKSLLMELHKDEEYVLVLQTENGNESISIRIREMNESDLLKVKVIRSLAPKEILHGVPIIVTLTPMINDNLWVSSITVYESPPYGWNLHEAKFETQMERQGYLQISWNCLTEFSYTITPPPDLGKPVWFFGQGKCTSGNVCMDIEVFATQLLGNTAVESWSMY